MPLLSVTLMLCALSLVVLYSTGGEDIELFKQQSARIGFAFVIMVVFSYIRPTILMRWSLALYMLVLLLLIATHIVGININGAQRWLHFGPIYFQPSEIAKISVPMMIAWILTRSPLPVRLLPIIFSILAVSLPVILLILQPDLGTAILISSVGLLIIFLAGISWKSIAIIAITVLSAAPILWNLVFQEYQRQRILTLFDPWVDPSGAGYHTIQSMIAVGSGGVSGKGWLASTQARLDFIPERSTDFVFAVYAEEFGLLGALFLIALYLFASYRGMFIVRYARDNYSRLLGGCLSTMLFCYVFVNIGMVVSILPVVGVPLPFISQGGSSLVSLMISFGILMSIHRYREVFYLR